jgi:hypothetical protein
VDDSGKPAGCHRTTLLRQSLTKLGMSLDKPGLPPTDPFLRIGISCRFALDRMKAAEEL